MKRKQLKESLSWSGKLFFAGILSYISGNKNIPKIPIKLKLTQEQREVISDVIEASKEFHDEIKKPNSKIEEVMNKMKKRNEAKKNFEKTFGFHWPL